MRGVREDLRGAASGAIELLGAKYAAERSAARRRDVREEWQANSAGRERGVHNFQSGFFSDA